MRILRGKSNLEVSSQGIALFVVGLVLATFLGGAVRTILSSDRVHQRIVSELKNRFPRNEFQIGRTQVLLSRGLWPGLGLRLYDVVFKQDVCGKLSFNLTVPMAVLPVDLFSLRHGRARLGHVEIDDAHLHLDYRDCPPKPGTDDTKAPAKSVSEAESGLAVNSLRIRPPRLDWSEFSKSLGALGVKNLSVTYERDQTWKLIFKRAEMELSDEMSLQAVVDVQKSLPFGTLDHMVELQAQGEHQNLTWTVSSDFKEGDMSLKGSWDLVNNSASGHLQLTQLPLKDFTSELFQMGLIENDIKLKTAWLTCTADWAGMADKASVSPVRLKTCKLEGAYGRVDVGHGEFFAGDREHPFHEAAKFNVQKLQLQPLVESLGRQVLPAVIAQLGVWTGTVTYAGPKIWQVDGGLENAEVVFSNQSVRGKQTINRAHTLIQRTDSGVRAVIDDVVLQEGAFSGHLDMHLGEDWRTGTFNADIDRLALSPSIQNLLIGGSIAPVKIVASGRLDAGELSLATAQVHVASLMGEGWRGEALTINARFIPGLLILDAKAQRAEADTRWRLFSQLQTTGKSISEALAWRDLSLKLEVQNSGGTVSQFSGVELPNNHVWRAKGSWIRDGALNGTLLVNSSKPFVLRGEKGSFHIQDKSAEPAD